MIPDNSLQGLQELYLMTQKIPQRMQSLGIHSISIDFNGRDVIYCKGGPKFCYPVGKSLDFYAESNIIQLRFKVYDGYMEVRDGLIVYDNGSPYYNPKFERLVTKPFPITRIGLGKLLELGFAYKTRGPHDMDYSSLTINNYAFVLSEIERTCNSRSSHNRQ